MKKKIAVLTGAGMSAESGIPTFRDANGLWENHKVEDVATPQAWHTNPELVTRFYNERRKKLLTCNPNSAHYDLTTLEKEYDVTIITQNIDDLHERAGSTNIIHIHGELLKARCPIHNDDIISIKSDITDNLLSKCGKPYRPHVVWFGENVLRMQEAIHAVNEADIFIIIGTSMQVYPAAGLLYEVNQNTTVYIIDKHIPRITTKSQFIKIESSATKGMKDVLDILMPKHK